MGFILIDLHIKRKCRLEQWNDVKKDKNIYQKRNQGKSAFKLKK